MIDDFAILLVQDGDSTRQQWELRKKEMIVGRDDECDIVVNDRQVSRQHAKITHQKDQYFLFDLDSKNGTFVNGTAVSGEGVALKDGDQIGIALSSRLIFVGQGATAPLPGEKSNQPEIKIDTVAKRVWVCTKEINPPLSLAQYRLLALLFEKQGGVISREEVVNQVWSGEESEGVSEQAIDALARRLRERISEIDSDNDYVITVRGHGFRLENFVE